MQKSEGGKSWARGALCGKDRHDQGGEGREMRSEEWDSSQIT